MIKQRYGNKYGRVSLTKEEINELKRLYPNHYNDYINKLDENIEKTNRFYSSHFDILISQMKKDVVVENIDIGSDLVSRARKIFIEYDGNNRNEIFELRKLWEPKCSKCGSIMEFWKFTEEFEIGHPPASIFQCPNCTNYYHVEVSRKQEVNGVVRPTTVTWAYGEHPEDWSDEVLAKILASIFRKEK